MKEIENLKEKANMAGGRAVLLEEELMKGDGLPFVDRHKLEISLYTMRIEQSEYNLKYQEALIFLRESK